MTKMSKLQIVVLTLTMLVPLGTQCGAQTPFNLTLRNGRSLAFGNPYPTHQPYGLAVSVGPVGVVRWGQTPMHANQFAIRLNSPFFQRRLRRRR